MNNIFKNTMSSMPYFRQISLFDGFRTGLLNWLTGNNALTEENNALTEEVDEKNSEEAKESCVKLNPDGERQGIRNAIAVRNRPARGCYLPLEGDFKEFRTKRGASRSSSQGYQRPTNIPNFIRVFRSSSAFDANNVFRFNGVHGIVDGDQHNAPRGSVCRCVGEAW